MGLIYVQRGLHRSRSFWPQVLQYFKRVFAVPLVVTVVGKSVDDFLSALARHDRKFSFWCVKRVGSVGKDLVTGREGTGCDREHCCAQNSAHKTRRTSVCGSNRHIFYIRHSMSNTGNFLCPVWVANSTSDLHTKRNLEIACLMRQFETKQYTKLQAHTQPALAN